MSYPPPGSPPPPFDPYGQQQPASPYGQPQQPYGQQPGQYQQPGGYPQAPPPAPQGGFAPQPTPPPFPGGGSPFQQGGGFAPPPPPRRSGAKGKLVGCLGLVGSILVIIVIKVAFLGAGTAIDKADDADRNKSGEVSDTGNVDAISLRVGDCYKDTLSKNQTTSESVDEIKAIPCAQPHNAQVIGSVTMSGSYPLESEIGKRCDTVVAQWQKRYPTAYNKLASQKIGITYFFPNSSSWKSSYNRITCSLVAESGDLGPKLPTL